jgi:adenine phosphoribosyltransferase
MNLAALIRDVPDFPIPGILFRDITPLLRDPAGLKQAIEQMAEPWREARVDLVAAMEARGFMFGAAMATLLGAGFVPVRKPGKLPWRTKSVTYSLEYREDVLQIHEDAVRPGERVLVVDDVIATGGTAAAVVELIDQLGGVVVGVQFLIELADLKGRDLLKNHQVNSLITY